MPSDMRKKEKKALIQQAAKKLFFHFGYSKTSMNDIARQSNLAKPTIYYYFSSKEAIFDDVVIEEATNFIAEIRRQVSYELPADERLKQVLQHTYNSMKIYSQRLTDGPDYLYDHSPHGHPIVQKLNNMYKAFLLPILQAGRDEGIFEIENAEIGTEAVLCMIEFMNLDWMRYHPEPFRDQVIETTTDLILNGLKRR